MSVPATRAESKVITDVHQVYRMLKDQTLNHDGKLTLPLEIHQTPYITVAGLVPGDPKARVTKEDVGKPMITEKTIEGYSIYRGHNAGGAFSRVVLHMGESHVLSVIKIQHDTDTDGNVKQRLFISKDFVHDMLLVKEDQEVEDVVKANKSLTDTVWF